MKTVVAFDFDGTLLDSRARHGIVLGDILAENNIDIDVSDLIDFKRDGANNVAFLISRGVDDDVARRIQSEWVRRIERDDYLAHDTMYADALDLLNKYGAGADLVLITARANVAGLHAQVDKFNLKKYFRDIYVVSPGVDAAAAKADILSRIGAVCIIGDTASDACAAKTAGIEFIFHENGFHNKHTAMGI